MNITSYNITDVSYHYIGLRVLDAVPSSAGRPSQFEAISRGVVKYVNDKALRLMLPEPRGTFETIGIKVCQELVHLGLANSDRSGYSLTESGKGTLQLLASRKYVKLRKVMIAKHIATYDNFHAVLQSHIDRGAIWRPIVDAKKIEHKGYLQALLTPTFGRNAATEVATRLDGHFSQTSKTIEAELHSKVIQHVIPNRKVGPPLFRTICDRLVSLRLLNIRRIDDKDCKFMKSYSPSVIRQPPHSWYEPLYVELPSETYQIYLCEPDMSDKRNSDALLKSLDEALPQLMPEGGYYDIPEVRDVVCEALMIPEAAFDEGINSLLDRSPAVLSVGLRYERISGLRKPLVRNKQIVNLLRRV